MTLLLVARVLAFLVGAAAAYATAASAIRTFVLPRAASDALAQGVFLGVRSLFNLRMKRARTFEDRDRIMALYAPVSLVTFPTVLLTVALLGYMAMFWALGVGSWRDAFKVSGSSLLTLGFSTVDSLPTTILAFSEAAFGLILVALLIGYIPTMYTAFSRREAAVTMLEVAAGSPPSAVEMILRLNRLDRLDLFDEIWRRWETWFVDVEESHTSLAALPFFRSPQPEHSWVTAAGAVLDSAALVNAAVDVPRNRQADLCIRAGYICLRRIAAFFKVHYEANVGPDTPISIARAEFDEACDRLAAANVPLKPDRDQAWRDFAGWRANYDTVLLALALLTMAPYAPWSSDRSLRPQRTLLARLKSRKAW